MKQLLYIVLSFVPIKSTPPILTFSSTLSSNAFFPKQLHPLCHPIVSDVKTPWTVVGLIRSLVRVDVARESSNPDNTVDLGCSCQGIFGPWSKGAKDSVRCVRASLPFRFTSRRVSTLLSLFLARPPLESHPPPPPIAVRALVRGW